MNFFKNLFTKDLFTRDLFSNTKCSICNKPVNEYYEISNEYFCPDCYSKYKMPRCVVCNKPIKYKAFCNSNGTTYCPDCEKKYPQCWHCNLPAKYTGFKDDDFILCQKCSKNTITKIEDLKALYYKLKDYTKRACGINASIKKAVLLSSTELKKQTQNNKADSLGYRTMGFCKTIIYTDSGINEKQVHIIYVQNGMPYNMTFKTLAHEYGHAWEYQNKKNINNSTTK